MKATGMIRRVDDLGRVVIPKEIRRMFRIRENDPLEIYIEDDCVIFKKFSELDKTSDRVRIATAMARQAGIADIAIYDNRDKSSGLAPSFPQEVPIPWMDLSAPAVVDGFSVYPIFAGETRRGYVVSETGLTVEMDMIWRYLIASFE